MPPGRRHLPLARCECQERMRAVRNPTTLCRRNLAGLESHMDDTDAFLAAVLPRMREADTALHSGDPRGRIAMWSRVEPLTLFGAAVAHTGWPGIQATFEWLGTTFADCQ